MELILGHFQPGVTAINSKPDDQRRLLESIHKSAVDAIITIDEQGLIETVNPATQAMFGYTPEELLGRNVKLLMPSPYHEEHDGYLANYLQTSQPKIIGFGREVVAQRKNGSTFPVHLAISEVSLDGRRVFAGFIRDLSELKLIEKHQATLGRIIEDSLNEVYIFDAETLKFLQVNRGARENLGYTLEEMRALTPIDLKTRFDRRDFETMIQPLRSGECELLNFSTQHERKDGTCYDVDVHLHLTDYLSKRVFVSIVLDVTKRRQAERLIRQQQEIIRSELEDLVEARTTELRQVQADLIKSEKFSTLGKVSGGIAHEIRNPLNAVKSSAYYLLNATNPTEEKVREHLDRIDRQVSLIDNVITALSDVAKLPEANLQPIAMESVLRNITAAIDLPANIQVTFDFPTKLPHILADEAQIVIAFRNLIRNARDAMPDGGTIMIGAIPDDQTITFYVADTGVGISEQVLEKIVEPLFTTKARGMGLGLSISLAIVEKNRGKLKIESVLGRGSKFSVTLEKHLA
jgi:two-component system sensor kinase FixL